jgi:choline dehydrogenase-like flavoprotein
MILDANSIAADTVLKAKYCVIGSGMGGATLSQKLASGGQDVLLVEAGGFATHDEARSPVAAEYVGRPFRRPPTRCIELGGSSNQWHGMCAALDDVDFETRPWIADSGWPIRRSDLHRFYLEASEMHGIESYDRFDPSALTQDLLAQSKRIGLDEAIVQRKIFQYRKAPRRWKGVLSELAARKKLRCLLHAPALELIFDADGTKVSQLIVGAGDGTIRVQAEVFIVCAGTLETPRLLLNSRKRHVQGAGNARDLVGRNLLDHPAGNFSKLKFKRTRRAPLYAGLAYTPALRLIAGLGLSADEQRRHALPNHYFMIRPSLTGARIPDELRLSFLAIRGARDLSWPQVKAILTNPDILNRVLVTRLGIPPYYRYGDLFFFTEQLPNPQSRVRLSPTQVDRHRYPIAQIDWQLSGADLQHFERYTRTLLDDGLRSPQYRIHCRDELALWDSTVASAAHHVGTARMAGSRDRGVVDEQLKVFDTNNLYIADGSVFPTAGSTNPSLTITALALRLAAHLLSQAGAPQLRST